MQGDFGTRLYLNPKLIGGLNLCDLGQSPRKWVRKQLINQYTSTPANIQLNRWPYSGNWRWKECWLWPHINIDKKNDTTRLLSDWLSGHGHKRQRICLRSRILVKKRDLYLSGDEWTAWWANKNKNQFSYWTKDLWVNLLRSRGISKERNMKQWNKTVFYIFQKFNISFP